jgi:ABC-type Fe3+-citrate transport system substrate-binding protein
MATLDSPSAPDRIENAVERELARRRRLLRLYLLLLLVPLGLAAWFLVAGRSDHKILRETVEQRVAPVEKRYERIAPKLERVERLDEDLVVVQQAAEQLQAQEKQVETLQRQVQEIAPAVREIQASQTSLLRTVQSAGELKELSARLAEMETSIARVQARQIEVQRDLKAVQLRVEKQPAGSAHDLDPKQLNDLIDTRLRVMMQSGKGMVLNKKDISKDPPPQ